MYSYQGLAKHGNIFSKQALLQKSAMNILPGRNKPLLKVTFRISLMLRIDDFIFTLKDRKLEISV